jgi:Spectrin repeat
MMLEDNQLEATCKQAAKKFFATDHWYTNKSIIMCAGRDLIGVQNLMKKHQALLAELAGHEGRITAVCSQGDQMVKEGHFAGEDITRKEQELQEKWNSLKVI